MSSNQFVWPEGEEIVYLRPPNEEYTGKLDCFYSPDSFPELAPLKENWEKIRDEILEFEKKNGALSGMSSYSPANVSGGQWSLIYLESFMWKFYKNRKKFPFICSVVDQIPNCVFSAVSILPPHTEIKPHNGDTNGIVRTHLGLIIPAPHPICSIKVGEEERGWENGELLCFINVKRHSVWNNSSEKRYLLMVDFIPQELADKKIKICADGLGSQGFIYLYKNIILIQKLPVFMHDMICKAGSLFWRLYLPIQRRFEFL